MSPRLHGIEETPEADLTAERLPIVPWAIKAPELRMFDGVTKPLVIIDAPSLVVFLGRYGGGPTLTSGLQVEIDGVWQDTPYLSGEAIETIDFAGRRIRTVVEATASNGEVVSIFSDAVQVAAVPRLATSDMTTVSASSGRRTADQITLPGITLPPLADDVNVTADSNDFTVDARSIS